MTDQGLSQPLRFTFKFKKHQERGGDPQTTTPEREQPAPPSSPTTPHVALLLALAHHIDGQVQSGAVKSYDEMAKRLALTRARMTQITNLPLLASEIQEKILFLPPTSGGCHRMTERGLRQLVAESSFENQGQLWRGMRADASSA